MGKSNPTSQLALIELKQRILNALNKLGDRDTQHIAIEELDRISETLSPEGVSVCLSCLYDIDLQQKNAMRKHSVKMFGTLASFHNDVLAPHLAKIVKNIVRRLRDPDSSVRDACVEVMGTLAARLSYAACTSASEGGAEGALAGPLSVFSKPLFDALNEQHRGVQVGAAMCLAGVIDNFKGAPPSSLQRLCPRIIKLLNGTTFSAKFALLSVIASIVEAGGVTSHQCLAMVMACIQDCLKNNDWSTRKAASETLACIASCGGASLGSFKLQVLEALESCRFDKVKPVRDTVVQTLEVWKKIPTSVLPSDKISFKENAHSEIPVQKEVLPKKNGDAGEVLQQMAVPYQSFEGCFGFNHARTGPNKITCGDNQKKHVPLVDKGASPEVFEKIESMEATDAWQIDIALPKAPKKVVAVAPFNTETQQTIFSSSQKIPHDECGTHNKNTELSRSASQTSKFQSGSGPWVHEASLVSSSSSSTVECLDVSQMNDLVYIRKQLQVVEDQQIKILELLQNFITTSEQSFEELEARITGPENTVGNLVARLENISFKPSTCSLNRLDSQSGMIWRRGEAGYRIQDISVSAGSISSGQSWYASQVTGLGQPGINEPVPISVQQDRLEVSPHAEAHANSQRVQIDVSAADHMRMGRAKNVGGVNHFLSNKVLVKVPSSSKLGESPSARGIRQASKKGATLASIGVSGEDCRLNAMMNKHCVDSSLGSACHRYGGLVKGSFWSIWSRAAEFLRSGDVESAYIEILCAGDELLLVRLMSRTGPAFEYLSSGTAQELLRMIIHLLFQQSFLDIILQWLQQIVDLAATSGSDCIELSTVTKSGLVASLEEAAAFEYSELWIGKSLHEMAVQLSSSWALLR